VTRRYCSQVTVPSAEVTHNARHAARPPGAAQARQHRPGVRLAGLKGSAVRRTVAQGQIATSLEEEASAAAYAGGRRDHGYAIQVALGELVPPRPEDRNGGRPVTS
jgi:hypothetical protein